MEGLRVSQTPGGGGAAALGPHVRSKEPAWEARVLTGLGACFPRVFPQPLSREGTRAPLLHRAHALGWWHIRAFSLVAGGSGPCSVGGVLCGLLFQPRFEGPLPIRGER